MDLTSKGLGSLIQVLECRITVLGSGIEALRSSITVPDLLSRERRPEWVLRGAQTETVQLKNPNIHVAFCLFARGTHSGSK